MKKGKCQFLDFCYNFPMSENIDYKGRLIDGLSAIIAIAQKSNYMKDIERIAKSQMKNVDFVENKSKAEL